jgi:GT2 family glycosyltransferase
MKADPSMTSTLPDISVIIACYDQTRELDLTLTSFLNQSYPQESYELIVVDDHSPTHTARDVVARRRARHPSATIIYARQHRDDGGSYGSSGRVKNIGARLARGNYVFFNNSEIVQAGESLAHISAVMEAAGQPLCLRGVVKDLAYECLAGRTPGELERLHDECDARHERTATADHAGLAAIPRSLFLALGGIDERFDYWGKEDLDLAARLKRAGARYVYDERLKSFHISHPANHVKQGDYSRMISLLEENNARHAVEVNRGFLWGALNPPPRATLEGSIILEADGDLADLERRLEFVIYGPGAERREALVVCLETERPQVEGFLAARYRTVPLLAVAPEYAGEALAARACRRIRTELFDVLRVGGVCGSPDWRSVADAARVPALFTNPRRAAVGGGYPPPGSLKSAAGEPAA